MASGHFLFISTKGRPSRPRLEMRWTGRFRCCPDGLASKAACGVSERGLPTRDQAKHGRSARFFVREVLVCFRLVGRGIVPALFTVFGCTPAVYRLGSRERKDVVSVLIGMASIYDVAGVPCSGLNSA